MNIGLIGVGTWGINYYNDLVRRSNVRLFSVRNDYSKFKSFEQSNNHVYLKNWKELFKCELDGVVIATPPDLHHDMSVEFLKRYIPVLVEKPITMSIDELNSINECSKCHKTPILVNNIHLFSGPFEEIRNKVLACDITKIESFGGNNGPFRSYSALWDYGPHDLSMCLSLFQRMPDKYEIDAIKNDIGHVYNMKLLFGNSTCNITVGNGFEVKNRRLTVVCTSDIYQYSYAPYPVFMKNGVFINGNYSKPLIKVIDTFLECVQMRKTSWQFSFSLNYMVTHLLTEFHKIIESNNKNN